MVDVIKYKPENTTAEQFMRPPTEGLGPVLFDTALLHEEQVNKFIRDQSPGIATPPRFQVGTELELIFFADGFVPEAHSDEDKKDSEKVKLNPNYRKDHEAQVRRLVRGLTGFRGKRGIFYPYDRSTIWNISCELRTKPGDVTFYGDATAQIRDFIATNAGDMHPVVHSQHFHLSLANGRGYNVLSERNSALTDAVRKGIVDTYRRFLPLLLLPEELEREFPLPTDGVIVKRNRNNGRNLRRVEGRLASSEYMFDPNLNILVHVLGIARGLEHIDDPEGLFEDGKYPPNYHHLTIGGDSYQRALKGMASDEILRQYLPGALIDGLVSRASMNVDISRGVKTVAEVRGDVWTPRVRPKTEETTRNSESSLPLSGTIFDTVRNFFVSH